MVHTRPATIALSDGERQAFGFMFYARSPRPFDGDIVMIDSSCVRVHQHAATGKRGIETMAAWDVPVAA